MVKRRVFPTIEVSWLDHHHSDGEREPTPADELRPVLWNTRGFLVSENAEMIQVARDTCSDPNFHPADATISIMRQCIVTMKISERSVKK